VFLVELEHPLVILQINYLVLSLMPVSDLPPKKRRPVLGIKNNTRFDPMTTPSNKRQIHKRRPPTSPPPKLL
jgi:hypothetical protein